MKRIAITALLAVFLSLNLAGCYTKLKEPGTGERVYSSGYIDDSDYYYYDQYYFHYGWTSPYFYGYPSYYGYISYPWWYDPYYQNDNGRYSDGRTRGDKAIRSRRGNRGNNLPAVPGGSYTLPPTSGQGDQGTQTPPSSGGGTPSNNNNNNDNNNSGNSGKSTRQRR